MMFDHAADEQLAQYSEGRLEEPELGQVEEHLLIGEQCCTRLTTFDDAWGLSGMMCLSKRGPVLRNREPAVSARSRDV
jgi:hypothetical protein